MPKKQAAKNPTTTIIAPPEKGSKVWASRLSHKQGPLLALTLADGTVVACTFIKARSVAGITKYWQRLYPHLSFQTGKAPKAPVLKKAAPIGTDFQRAVWLAAAYIPAGCVATYRDIAIIIGKPKAMRAVGNALGLNPLAPLIPCHRVIATGGRIGGYGGGASDLATKRKLLRAEGIIL